ncbi:hypothetical protein AOR13_746 [Alteromonas stellipolaris LMG 21856]|nr:hypothetical protein AOR13_746 [Alteromonas stellipolaris LMG 21856]
MPIWALSRVPPPDKIGTMEAGTLATGTDEVTCMFLTPVIIVKA